MRHLRLRKQIVALILLTSVLAVSLATAFAGEDVPPKVGDGASPRVLVAYYSLTGNTEKMALGVAEGIAACRG